MKFVTWNVNGLRACLEKGLLSYLRTTNADIIGLQEIKTDEPVPELNLPGYSSAWNCSSRRGYSGTVCLFKTSPDATWNGFGNERFDRENRIVTLEYPSFIFVNVYVPNSASAADRWNYRLEWDAVFGDYLNMLLTYKPVVVAGDFNVAVDYLDIYPENTRNAEEPEGFTLEERDGFNSILKLGFVDAFRTLHPTERVYSWWSAKQNDRKDNLGRRIDYVLVPDKLRRKIKRCDIRTDVFGSDHAPVEATIKL